MHARDDCWDYPTDEEATKPQELNCAHEKKNEKSMFVVNSMHMSYFWLFHTYGESITN